MSNQNIIMSNDNKGIKTFFKTSYFAGVVTGFVMLLCWDVLWSLMTTFRGMSFAGTYLYAMTLAMVAAVPSAFNKKTWLQAIVWYVLAIYLEANLMYCRTYMTWIPLESYGLALNLSDFTASITDSLRVADIALLLIPAAGLFFCRRGARLEMPQAKIWLICFGALIIADAVTAIAYGGLRTHIKNLTQECYYATTPPVAYTAVMPPLVEIFDTEAELTPEEKEKVDAWLREQRRREEAYPETPRAERRNLVFIFCESLENWPIGSKADGKTELMPFLNSVIKDTTTLYVPHVQSQTGSGRSIDAQLLMLAGMMPMSKQVWSMTYPRNTYHALPEAMKKRNPATRATLLTSDKPITWNQILVAEAFGIDSIISRDNWEETELVGHPAKLSDGALMSQIAKKFATSTVWPEGSPAFIQIVTYSGHNPFQLPDKLKRIHISDRYPEKMADYMTMQNYVDHSLSVIVEYLKSRSDWGETMVVIAGDHEALGTYRKEWLTNPAAAEILSAQGEVPLIILNSPYGGTLTEPIGQVDVYSTILDLMGLRSLAEWPGMGTSVLNPDKKPYDRPEAHIKEAPEVSEILIRHNLLKR